MLWNPARDEEARKPRVEGVEDVSRRARSDPEDRYPHVVGLIESVLGPDSVTGLGRRLGVDLWKKLEQADRMKKLEWDVASGIARELDVGLLDVVDAFARDRDIENLTSLSPGQLQLVHLLDAYPDSVHDLARDATEIWLRGIPKKGKARRRP